MPAPLPQDAHRSWDFLATDWMNVKKKKEKKRKKKEKKRKKKEKKELGRQLFLHLKCATSEGKNKTNQTNKNKLFC